MEIEKDKWFNLALVLMLIAVGFGGYHYYETRLQECTSNPLPYASQLYEETFDIREATGSMTLWPNNPLEEPIFITFNSEGFKIRE